MQIHVFEADAAIMDGSTRPSCCSGKLLHVKYKTDLSQKMKSIGNSSTKKSRCEK